MQVEHAKQDLVCVLPNVFLTQVLVRLLLVFNQLGQVSFLSILHYNVQMVFFKKGSIVLNNMRVVEFAQVLNFFECLKLTFMVLFVKTYFLHYTTLD